MKSFLCLLGLILSLNLSSQYNPKKGTITVNGGEVFDIMTLTKAPAFKGGIGKLDQFISQNLRYPDSAKFKCISGTVYVSFIVEADGAVSNVTIERGLGYGLDEIALSAVEKMPIWEPGELMGKFVRSKFILPIKFQFR